MRRCPNRAPDVRHPPRHLGCDHAVRGRKDRLPRYLCRAAGNGDRGTHPALFATTLLVRCATFAETERRYCARAIGAGVATTDSVRVRPRLGRAARTLGARAARGFARLPMTPTESTKAGAQQVRRSRSGGIGYPPGRLRVTRGRHSPAMSGSHRPAPGHPRRSAWSSRRW